MTLKMRLGWDAGSMNAAEIAARAEAAGVRMITVHGRTRCQFYSGAADWAAIAAGAAGGAASRSSPTATSSTRRRARRALARSGADAVMIGRGARGRPWLLGRGRGGAGGARRRRRPPAGAELSGIVCAHYEAMLGFYGRDLGLRVARKHLGWYLDGIAGAAGLRGRLLTADRPRGGPGRLARGLADCGGLAEEAAA